MNDLDRIEDLLANKRLNADVFERFAQDSLSPIFPGLSPIPGGTDWGRDGDITVAASAASVSTRLLVTSSRTYKGVRDNMVRGLRSMRDHGVAVDRIVLANPALLSTTQRHALAKAAQKESASLDVASVFDRGWVASRLRRDGFWRKELLDLSADPIALSRTPTELAESPWASLPLAGRDEELSALAQIDGDVVVAGVPGAGKSRLLQEVPDVVFVDTAASLSQIAADIRWLCPQAVVIDDSARHQRVVKRLLQLRNTEPDLFTFKLLLVCWPDEIDSVNSWLSQPSLLEVDLLERSHVNEIVIAMGITGLIARGVLLEQAEGRPGWAIALGDLLIRNGDFRSVVSGQGLLGEVTRYLRRAGADDLVMDLLAVVAALGGVDDKDLHKLAREFGLTRPRVAKLLASSAQSGLLDIAHGYSYARVRATRTYLVRPPMLARVLVAERFFQASVPAVDFESLIENWPEHTAALAAAAIRSAFVDAPGAWAVADDLFELALGAEAVSFEQRSGLCSDYLHIGKAQGERVLTLIREAFAAMAGPDSAFAAEGLATIAADLVRTHQLPGAVDFLLDAALADRRPQNPHSSHPARQLGDLVKRFHPEVPTPFGLRVLVIDRALEWFKARPTPDAAAVEVLADVLSTCMSLDLHGYPVDPGSPMTISIYQTVLSPEDMQRVYDEIWPKVRPLLAPDADHLSIAMINVVAAWLRVGAGYDQPFGQPHPADRIRAARRLGQALAKDLASDRDKLSFAAQVYLRNQSRLAGGVRLALSLPTEVEPFLRDVDRSARGDIRARAEKTLADVRSLARTWADQEPAAVIARLADLQRSIEIAQLRWPDRIWSACETIAAVTSIPGDWLIAALDGGLASTAVAFLVPALDASQVKETTLDRLLEEPQSRFGTLSIALERESEEAAWLTDTAFSALRSSDWGLFEMLAIRGDLPPHRGLRLLQHPDPSVRSAFAAALHQRHHLNEGGWLAHELRDAWLAAISAFRITGQPRASDHEASELFEYLIHEHPTVAVALIEDTIVEAGDDVYDALSHSTWDTLHELGGSEKSRLWRRFVGTTAEHMVRDHLIGTDLAWMEAALDAGDLTPTEAVGTFRGFGPQPPLQDLARLLVPRGIPPDHIAGIAMSGSWMGDESARYEGIRDSFAAWLDTEEDPNVRATAEAGVRIFEAARTEALAKEKRERIRGYR